MDPFQVLEVFEWVMMEETGIELVREKKHFLAAKRALRRMNISLKDLTLRRKFQDTEGAFTHLCRSYFGSSKYNEFGSSPTVCFSEDTFRRWREGFYERPRKV